MKGTKTLLSYLLFIIGLQWKTVYALPQGCPEGEFMCANKRCILQAWKCDEEDDCGDKSDEKDCPKRNRECDASKDFKCYNGKCVPLSYTCDNVDDCGDNSDEDHVAGPFCPKTDACLPTYFQCNTTKKCIEQSFHCDGIADCGDDDSSDEQNCDQKTCAADEFKCANGNCISSSWKCDNNDDCLDQSDEKNCNNKNCSSNEFKCIHSGHCIRLEYRCDGGHDCLDQSDELGCNQTTLPPKLPRTSAIIGEKPTVTKSPTKPLTSTTTTPPCRSNEFPCPGSTKCLHRSWICDGEPDCPGKEDESIEVCSPNKCDINQFRCSNGKCIELRDKCDGVDHCPDGSDEKNCSALTITCSQGTYLCKNTTNKCIDPSNLCNGKNDCPFNDDEDTSCGINECEINNGSCSQYCHDKTIGYECKCKIGYKLSDDLKTCVDINECLQPGMCSQKCHNTVGSFKCQCEKGYTLDPVHGKICRASAPEPVLVFSDKYDVRQISTNGKDYRSIAITKSSAAIALDIKDEMIYWTDIVNKTINRIHKDNKGMGEVVVGSGLERPESLAIDWLSRKIYWTDTHYNTISVSDLDGNHVKTIVRGKEGEDLRTLAVYPEKGLIFWTDWGDVPKMERAHLSGDKRETIVNHDEITWASSIAIDPTLEKIFWADMNKKRICSSDIDGKNIQEVVTGLTNPYGVAVFEDYVYWTDFHVKKLFKANKFNGLRKFKFGSYMAKPMDITVYHHLLQANVSHPCKENNGGCSHLCFPAPSGKHECSCPNGMSLSSDGKTCEHTVSTTSAPTTEDQCAYKCHSSRKCIPASKVCDGIIDCPEHDDETTCARRPVIVAPAPTTTESTGLTSGSQKKSSNDLIKISVVVSVCILVIIVALVILFLYKKKRSRSDLRMIYQTEDDSVYAGKGKDVLGVSVKYLPSTMNRDKKLRSDKNFDNVNFMPGSKIPLQMSDMYGDTIVDEYPGSDDDYDDRAPIIPHAM